jgi:hypothetical protein
MDSVTAVATRAAQRLVRGTRRGSSLHLHVVRVVAAMSAEIFDLLLGVDRRWRGGLLIFLIKEAVEGFF